MKITIVGSGEDFEDDRLVLFNVCVENETHKTTIEFYEHVDVFRKFAKDLAQFPFKNKKDVVFKQGYWSNSPYHLQLKIKLADGAGRIVFYTETLDDEGNEAKFSSDWIEAEAVSKLADGLLAKDFRSKTEFSWQSV